MKRNKNTAVFGTAAIAVAALLTTGIAYANETGPSEDPCIPGLPGCEVGDSEGTTGEPGTSEGTTDGGTTDGGTTAGGTTAGNDTSGAPGGDTSGTIGGTEPSPSPTAPSEEPTEPGTTGGDAGDGGTSGGGTSGGSEPTSGPADPTPQCGDGDSWKNHTLTGYVTPRGQQPGGYLALTFDDTSTGKAKVGAYDLGAFDLNDMIYRTSEGGAPISLKSGDFSFSIVAYQCDSWDKVSVVHGWYRNTAQPEPQTFTLLKQ